MVGKYVDKHLDAIFVGFGTHSDKLVASAELIVADFPIKRLVVVIPFACCAAAGVEIIVEIGRVSPLIAIAN